MKMKKIYNLKTVSRVPIYLICKLIFSFKLCQWASFRFESGSLKFCRIRIRKKRIFRIRIRNAALVRKWLEVEIFLHNLVGSCLFLVSDLPALWWGRSYFFRLAELFISYFFSSWLVADLFRQFSRFFFLWFICTFFCQNTEFFSVDLQIPILWTAGWTADFHLFWGSNFSVCRLGLYCSWFVSLHLVCCNIAGFS